METILLVAVIAIALVRWIYLRDRLNEMSERIDALARLVVQGTPRPSAATPEAERPVMPRPSPEPPPVVHVAPPPPPPLVVEPKAFPPPSLVEEPVPVPPPLRPVPPFEPSRPLFEPAPELPRRSIADWEALVGGNWVLKVGVLITVVAISLLLGQAYKQLGPLGRVAISIAVSLAMLVAGAIVESRDRYRIFAQGLLGGGWAALYFTVYAMQSLDAAKVIYNPWLGGILLLAVAAGMIVHSLRYRSQTVTGLAYFIAFATLAITQVTRLSVIALIPLAASLLYVAHHFRWRNFALFGLIATYAICASRGDTGAPLWQAESIFTIYWLLFEAFDILSPHPALLPLNALGFLGLSIVKWSHAAPGQIWELLAATAAAYLVGAIVRAHSGKWHGAATLTAALAAAAIFLKLDHQWIALALLLEAELFYLAGVRFGAPYLRYLAGSLFAVELGHLIVTELPDVPARAWTPVATLNVVVFYANRALRRADTFYGYAAAGMMALVAGYEAPHGDMGLAWMLLAAGPFLVGWRWRLVDFRLQGYGLAAIGPVGMAFTSPEPPLSIGIGAALSYAGALCALWSSGDRFLNEEQDALRATGSLAASTLLAAVVWRLAPEAYLGLGWMALAVVLLELGTRGLPVELRRQSYVLAALGAVVVIYKNILPVHNDGPLPARLIPAGAALLAYAMAARARKQEGGRVLDVASFLAAGFLLTGLWALLPAEAVGPAWAVVALVLVEFDIPVLSLQGHLVSGAAFARLFFANFPLPTRVVTVLPVLLSHYYLWSRTHKRFYLYTAAILAAVLMRFEMGRVFTATGWAVLALGLLYAGRRLSLQDLLWQSYALAGMAFARCWSTNFYSPDMFAGIAGPVLVGSTVVGCLYAAQLLTDVDSRPRLYFSLLASSLLAVLLYFEVSGSLLTVAWGVEGALLLAAGFPLRDRVLRLSGMALLMFCILKLFVRDLRHLEIVPRILSFMVLGLILLAVGWVYSRFREVLVARVLDLPSQNSPNRESL